MAINWRARHKVERSAHPSHRFTVRDVCVCAQSPYLGVVAVFGLVVEHVEKAFGAAFFLARLDGRRRQ